MKEDDYTNFITTLLNEHRDDLIELGRALFACPEPGFQEVKSSEILTSFLLREGIECEKNLCVTGFKATIGEPGGYHIALVADMDALYVTDEGRTYPYHSCGHSIQTAVMAYVMKLLKISGIVEKTGGCVSFIGTPAEEFIDFDFRQKLVEQGEIQYYSGKQNMICQGVFDDVDCVISMHINGDSGTLFDVGSTLAGFMVKKVRFVGKAAHSGAAPHLGRNALHGASLAMDGIAYLKDQFPPEAGIQIHPVISSCLGSVNIIPEETVLESYIRANTLEYLMEAGKKFDDCVVYCGKALGLECQVEDKIGYMPLKQSDFINNIVYEQMLKICEPDKIIRNVVSGASGDVGDLGYLLPAVQFGFSGMKGRIHSSHFDITDEENAYIHTAQIVLGTVAEILSNPEKQADRGDYSQRKAFYLKEWLHQK